MVKQMGLIKFITVFDDEKQMVFSESILKRYNISAYPSAFSCDNKMYYDGLNTDSSAFSDMSKHCTVIGPSIPAKVFQQAYIRAYNDGYFAVVVVCPHSKWFPYYDEAVLAANKFKRSKKYDFTTFRICVINSKSFAAGVMMHTLSMSRDHEINHCSSSLVIEYGRKNTEKNDTYILSKSPNAFCDTSNELVAFRSFGYKFTKLDISQSHDFIKFDSFSDIICKQLKKGNVHYAVSIGCNCEFAGNIIGRIEKKSGIKPICVMQYAVPSTKVLGDSSICINLFK